MIVLNWFRSFRNWLTDQILFQKLDNPLGFILITILALFVSAVVAFLGMKIGFLMMGLVVALPLIGACFFNLRFGLVVTLLISFFLQFIKKYGDIPLGIALDALVSLLFFSLIVKQILERDWSFAKHPISTWILIWFAFILLQFFNPDAGSRMAWVYSVRSLAGLTFFYFIACYIFKNLKVIEWFMKFILFLGLLSALYALKQEYIGFSDTEMAWLYADEERFQLIVQWSRFRVYSFFSDPTTMGVLMAYMAVFCLVLCFGPFKRWQKGVLVVSAILMIMALGYGGSRTPVVLIPAGFIFFVVMSLERNVIIISGILLFIGTLAMMKGTSNPVMFRIQSAFKPSGDASMQLRLNNQKLIQPYIQEHPFGGGLGSTGMWGARFTPDSWLADFQHDSGYVRIAVELGWIGLLIYCTFLLVCLRTGIYYYVRCRNPKIKIYYLGLTTVIFLLALSSYPQEVIPLLPTAIIFNIFLAMIVRLKDFDYEEDDPAYVNRHIPEQEMSLPQN